MLRNSQKGWTLQPPPLSWTCASAFLSTRKSFCLCEEDRTKSHGGICSLCVSQQQVSRGPPRSQFPFGTETVHVAVCDPRVSTLPCFPDALTTHASLFPSNSSLEPVNVSCFLCCWGTHCSQRALPRKSCALLRVGFSSSGSSAFLFLTCP